MSAILSIFIDLMPPQWRTPSHRVWAGALHCKPVAGTSPLLRANTPCVHLPAEHFQGFGLWTFEEQTPLEFLSKNRPLFDL